MEYHTERLLELLWNNILYSHTILGGATAAKWNLATHVSESDNTWTIVLFLHGLAFMAHSAFTIAYK